jgi:hypothetical protein
LGHTKLGQQSEDPWTQPDVRFCKQESTDLPSRVSREREPEDTNRVRREQLTLVHYGRTALQRNENPRENPLGFRAFSGEKTQYPVFNQKAVTFFSVFLS